VGQLQSFTCAQELVVGVFEVQLYLAREVALVADLDSSVEHAADGVARGRQRTADVQQIVPEAPRGGRG